MTLALRAVLAVAFAAPAAAFASATPEPFAPGVISNAKEQWRITFTPDGKTAYFAQSDGFFPITRKATIYQSTLADGAWSEPVVAPFSGTHTDMDPHLDADGKRLYFSSIRPPRADLDLWYVEREGDGWGEAVRLGDSVNSDADELYASVTSDGTLYFASGPAAPAAGAHWDIYQARPEGDGFAARTALPAGVNTVPKDGGGPQDAWEFNPEISRDGRTLYFCSLRPGGAGLGDIYASTRDGEGWSPARNLGAPVNTAADEYHPSLSHDGKTLYFARRVPKTGGDFFFVPLDGG